MSQIQQRHPRRRPWGRRPSPGTDGVGPGSLGASCQEGGEQSCDRPSRSRRPRRPSSGRGVKVPASAPIHVYASRHVQDRHDSMSIAAGSMDMPPIAFTARGRRHFGEGVVVFRKGGERPDAAAGVNTSHTRGCGGTGKHVPYPRMRRQGETRPAPADGAALAVLGTRVRKRPASEDPENGGSPFSGSQGLCLF
jgi:hypothetical protein